MCNMHIDDSHGLTLNRDSFLAWISVETAIIYSSVLFSDNLARLHFLSLDVTELIIFYLTVYVYM